MEIEVPTFFYPHVNKCPYKQMFVACTIATLQNKSTAPCQNTKLYTRIHFSFQVAICIWPLLQTFNFSVVPEKNRVPFVSMCSLLWTIFLAYMKQLELEKLQQSKSLIPK